MTLLLATARLGVIGVPMNIRQRPPETAYAQSRSRMAFTGTIFSTYIRISAKYTSNLFP
jgi:hypothetical protein